MLKRFLLNILSSFVGFWLAITLFVIASILLMVGMMGSMATSLASSSTTEVVKSRSILKLDLNGAIEEYQKPSEPDLSTLMSGGISAPLYLDVIINAIDEAEDNDDILAIYLKCGSISASPATLNAIRSKLLDFKKETNGKKKIIAYADSYSQGGYYIASVADEIYLNPAGELTLKGLASSGYYMKGLFDKIGLQFQVVKVGTYKSAVEPYILNEMSEPARAQLDTLFSGMWQYIRKGIADCRKEVTAEGIDSLINRDYISFSGSEAAKKAGLVDNLSYERGVIEKLSNIAGCEVKKLNFVGPATVAALSPWADDYNSKKRVAVLFAVGEIADGNDNQINFEKLVPVIQELAEDDNVKALVLRVNSPGGSVFGSDLIGEALDYFKSKGKPFVVSMGDYAASGGYWISAHADMIFADPLTITGSIGIFGLLPNFKGTLDMLGLNINTVATNPNALFPNGYAPLTDEQLAVMQKYVETGYDRFVSRVADGRKMKKEDVLRIAEGRVWGAQTALKIGLVDKLGSLTDAVDYAAAQAKLGDDYDLAAYPKLESTVWDMIMVNGTSMSDLCKQLNARDETTIKSYLLYRILNRYPIQARMPEYKVVF